MRDGPFNTERSNKKNKNKINTQLQGEYYLCSLSLLWLNGADMHLHPPLPTSRDTATCAACAHLTRLMFQ